MRRISPEKLSLAWLIGNLRLSVFPAERWEAPPDVWEKFVGGSLIIDQRQPVLTQSGEWKKGTLQFASAPPYVVVWTAVPPQAPDALPDFESWPIADVFSDFVAVTRAWLASAEFGVKRLGFGLQALLPAEDLGSANRLLQKIISVKIDPDTTTDFLYQINRPVSSRVAGQMKINRLTKWSTPLVQLVRAQLAPGMASTTTAGGRYFASLDSDINTPAERDGPLEAGSPEAIYDELVDLTLQKLERGDRE